MGQAALRRDLHLFRPLEVTGAVGLGPVVGAAVAADAFDEAGRGPPLRADRHAAAAAQAVGPRRQAVADRDPLVEDEAFAAPQAFRLGRRLQIPQYAAFQMED